MILLLAVAFAREPDWVEAFTMAPTAGPPDTPCDSVVRVESPGAESPAPPPSSAPSPPPPDLAAMVPFDLAPEALNDRLPSTDQARLQLGRPYDLAMVPLEALRGAERDRQAVRDVVVRAARGEETVRLAFWGASHVAGEYFTGELRRVLQDRGGDAGHGFVMPAAPWKGYRASDVNLCTRGTWVSDFDKRPGGRGDGKLGVAGMNVESADPASHGWVQTTRSNPHGRAVGRFEVMFWRNPGGGAMDLSVDDAPALRIETRGPPGPGLALLRVPDGPHRLAVTPVGDGPVRLFGVNMERERPGVVVDAMGVSGRTASSWLAWDPELVAAYLSRRQPDLAVLAYGTNEANDPRLNEEAYRTTLRAVLSRVRSLLPAPTACVLIGPSDRGRKVSGTQHVIWGPTEWVARVQREVGPEFGCATWDLQAASGGPGSVFRWRTMSPPLMAADLLHFNASGYQELARRFLAAVEQP